MDLKLISILFILFLSQFKSNPRLLTFILLIGMSTFSLADEIKLSPSLVGRGFSRPWPDEIKKTLRTTEALELRQEIKGWLDAMPESKKKPISDTQLALKWGVDWMGLEEHYEHERGTQEEANFLQIRKLPEPYKSPRIKKLEAFTTQFHLSPGDERLDLSKVEEDISKYYFQRFQQMEKSLPGFKEWIFEALYRTQWILTDRSIEEKFCKNSHIYRMDAQTVACQVQGVTQYMRSFYQSMVSDRKKVMDVLVHELFRYKVMSLASIREMKQLEQDQLTARLTYDFLSPSVDPESFFKTLQQVQLVPLDVENIRRYEIILNSYVQYYMTETLSNFIRYCASGLTNDSMFGPYLLPVFDNLNKCRRLAGDEAELFCDSSSIVLRMMEHRKYCYLKAPDKWWSPHKIDR